MGLIWTRKAEKARVTREREVLGILNKWNDLIERFREGRPTWHGDCECCKHDRARESERFSSRTMTYADLVPIAGYLSRKEDAVQFLRGIEDHTGLQKRLEALEHVYRYPILEGEPADIVITTPLQRVRVSMLLDALQGRAFIDQIGTLVDQNLRNYHEFGETGGLVVCDPTKGLSFMPKPSLSTSSDSHAMNARVPVTDPSFALFHLHTPEEDSTRYAGPSWDENGEFDQKTDLGMAARYGREKGQYHGVIITKLAGSRFNIDYFGFERSLVLDRRYNAVNVIDLGNYEYRRTWIRGNKKG